MTVAGSATQDFKFGFWLGLGFAAAALVLGLLEGLVHGRWRRGDG